MSKALFTTRVTFKNPDNWIVWYLGNCNIFKDETIAMQFIDECRNNNPDALFEGWKQSFNGENLVTVLKTSEEYDPDIAAEYLWKKYMAPQNHITAEPQS